MSLRRLVFPEFLWESLQNHLFPHPPERFAFGLVRPHKRDGRIDYTMEHLVVSDPCDYDHQSDAGLALSGTAATHFNRISADAAQDGLVPLHIHSHPPDVLDFSPCDDAHELATHQWLCTQGQPFFLSLVCPSFGQPQCRLWLKNDVFPCDLWVGLRPVSKVPEQTDNQLTLLRQAAFGNGLRYAARELRIGIVGLGGVGMAAIEPLVRAGFQKFTLIDMDRIGETNLNRLPGTRVRDIGKLKVNVARRLIHQAGNSIGTRPQVKSFAEDIYIASCRCKTALKSCDVILSLTDNHLSRIECLQLALESGAVFLQAGVEILLDEQPKHLLVEISGAELGRYCPICIGRLHPGQASLDARRYVGGDVWEHAQQHGYVPDIPAPAVMSINSLVSGALVLELQRRVAGLGTWDLWQHDFNTGTSHAISRIDDRLHEVCEVCGRSAGAGSS